MEKYPDILEHYYQLFGCRPLFPVIPYFRQLARAIKNGQTSFQDLACPRCGGLAKIQKLRDHKEIFTCDSCHRFWYLDDLLAPVAETQPEMTSTSNGQAASPGIH